MENLTHFELVHIFTFLTPAAAARSSLVCSQWNTIANKSNDAEYIWGSISNGIFGGPKSNQKTIWKYTLRAWLEMLSRPKTDQDKFRWATSFGHYIVAAAYYEKCKIMLNKNDITSAFVTSAAKGYHKLCAWLLSVPEYELDPKPVLLAAARNGQEEFLDGILKNLRPDYRFDLEKRDYNNDQFLALAIKTKNVKLVKYLLDKGANIESPSNAISALQLMISYDSVDMVRLLEKKIVIEDEIKKLDSKGQTLLYRAAHSGSAEIVNYLLEHKADPLIPNKDGQVPLFCAAKSPKLLSFLERLIFEFKVDLDYLTFVEPKGRTPTGRAAPPGENVTAIGCAVQGGNFAGLTLLVENGAKIDPIIHGDIMLYSRSIDVMNLLMDYGAVVPKDRIFHHIFSNVFDAAETKKLEFIPLLQRLLENGASLSAKSEPLFTPLFLCLWRGMYTDEIVQFLIDHTPLSALNEPSQDGTTAFLQVTINKTGCKKWQKILFEKGVNIHAEDNKGRNALFHAVSGQSSSVDYLRSLGIQVKPGNVLPGSNVPYTILKSVLSYINHQRVDEPHQWPQISKVIYLETYLTKEMIEDALRILHPGHKTLRALLQQEANKRS